MSKSSDFITMDFGPPTPDELARINKHLTTARNLNIAAQRTAAMNAAKPRRPRMKVLPGDPVVSQILYLRETTCLCGSVSISSRGLFDRRGPAAGPKAEKLDKPTSHRDEALPLEITRIDQTVSHCQHCLKEKS